MRMQQYNLIRKRHMHKTNLSRSRSQRGVSLVEVLVTVVVISVGLLGVSALHLTSLRNSFDSNSRSKATWLAHDIADRMRANRNAARSGNYTIAIGTSPSGTTIAATDLIGWKNQMSQSLTSGDGSIAVADIGSSKVFTITVQWKERDNATPISFVTQTEI